MTTVAPASAFPRSFGSSPTASPPPGGPRLFTVDEYQKLTRSGILSEEDSVELLEGWIVYKMPREPQHDMVVKLVEKAIEAVLGSGWHTRGQSAITTADSEPEPDVAVVAGDIRNYGQTHPRPADISLIVEVAVSSLARDRDLKGRLYARAGIPVYWIINLNDLSIEVYTDPSGPVALPTYRQRKDYSAGEVVPLMIPGQNPVAIKAGDLLP